MSLDTIKSNLEKVKATMAESCAKANRKVEEIKLLPVTKKQPLEKLQWLYELGEKTFGENRVQELNEKAPLLPDDIEWHLIGSLQSNKVRAALKYAKYIHSVDSVKLIERIDRIAGEEGKKPFIFLQINITGEKQKGGIPEGSLKDAVEKAVNCENLKLIGFMTMGALGESDDKTQVVFKRLAELRNSYNGNFSQITELSMGMSGDFPLAILEGATYIRVGSSILGARQY